MDGGHEGYIGGSNKVEVGEASAKVVVKVAEATVKVAEVLGLR